MGRMDTVDPHHTHMHASVVAVLNMREKEREGTGEAFKGKSSLQKYVIIAMQTIYCFLTTSFLENHTVDLIIKMVTSRAACICMHAFFNSALFLLNCHLFRAWAWRSLLCFGFWVLVLQYIRVINDSFFYIDVSSATAFHASGIQRDREREREGFSWGSLFICHTHLSYTVLLVLLSCLLFFLRNAFCLTVTIAS